MGGGSTPLAETTTSVPITVIDGAIENATVCLDKNSNGVCDAGEPTGKTSKTGTVNLTVDNADLGKYPVLAEVGTDAIDIDTGKVPVAFTMSTPAKDPKIVSPLTTMVHQTSVSSGLSKDEAEKLVKETTGITASLFEDFTKPSATATPVGSVSAAVVARMVVVTTQEQSLIIRGEENKRSDDGMVITKAMLDTAIQKKLLELLPSLITAMNDPAVMEAAPGAAREAMLFASAKKLMGEFGLKAESIATVVAINTQAASTTVAAVVAPSAGFSLFQLTFTDVQNYYARFLGATLAQTTPDKDKNTKFVEHRQQSNSGVIAKWGRSNSPARNSDLHWNGTAWANCPINFQNTTGPEDAQGNVTYNYCDGFETGKSNRANFAIDGKKMADVMASIRNAGYSNLKIGDDTDATYKTLLGTATFPASSNLRYQTNTPLSNAVAYYPGSSKPVGYSNVVAQYSSEVSKGGAFSSLNTEGCNSAEYKTRGSNSTTLESMVSAMTGAPCTTTSSSFDYDKITYTSPAGTNNDSWNNSTLSYATIGTQPTGTGAAPGFYTTNTKVRLAFTGVGEKAVTYYACKEQFINAGSRNCAPIGTGTYTIETLGDARVMTLNNLPAIVAGLTYTQVFVERKGLIYFGYKVKPTVSLAAHFTFTAANALASQLGITLDDPATPLALTAASYQGTWDVYSSLTTDGSRSVITLNKDGTVSCQNSADSTGFGCSLKVTNPANGTFTFTGGNGFAATGTIGFLTGSFAATNSADSTETF